MSKKYTFTWDAVPVVDGYNIYFKTPAANFFTRRNTSPITENLFDIFYQATGTYLFYVTSVKDNKEAQASDVIEVEISDIDDVIASSGLSLSDVTASSESSGWGDDNRMDAFDENNSTLWAATSHQNEWLQIDFGEEIRIVYVIHRNMNEFNTPREWKLQGSNDESTWDDLLHVEYTARINQDEFHDLATTGMYRYYRFFVIRSWSSSSTIRVRNTRLFRV